MKCRLLDAAKISSLIFIQSEKWETECSQLKFEELKNKSEEVFSPSHFSICFTFPTEPLSWTFGLVPGLAQYATESPLLALVEVSRALLSLACFSLFAMEAGRQGAADLLLHTPFFVLPACLANSVAVPFLLLWLPVYVANFFSTTNRGSRFQSYCEKPRVRVIVRIVCVLLVPFLLPFLLEPRGWVWSILVSCVRFAWIPFFLLNSYPAPKKSKIIRETNATRRISEFYSYFGGLCTVAHLICVGWLIASVWTELTSFDFSGALFKIVDLAVAQEEKNPQVGAALRVGLLEILGMSAGMILFELIEGYANQVLVSLALFPIISPAGAFCFFMIQRETDIRGPVRIKKAVVPPEPKANETNGDD